MRSWTSATESFVNTSPHCRSAAGWRPPPSSGPPCGGGAARTSSRRALLAGTLGLVVLATCRPGPWNPYADLVEIAPFVRLPYVQAVSGTGAWVLWRAPVAVRDSFEYRVEGSAEWRWAAVARTLVPARPEAAAAADTLVDRTVHLTGLPPDTRIEYRVHAEGVSPTAGAFRTAPGERGTEPVRVLAFGDSGWGSENQLRLASAMLEEPWDLAVHVGDIAYGQGTEREFTLRHFRVYADLLSSVPLFPAPGNHDLRTAGGQPYDRAFRWSAARLEVRYYTFRWGPIRFFALDSSSEDAGAQLRAGAGEQYAWLTAALDSASREPGLVWLVAYLHHPLHSHASGFAAKGPDRRLRAALIPLFERYGVDLVLSGHDHHYERSRPMRDARAVDPGCGLVYLVAGGGGASLYARSISPNPAVTARLAREHHFVSLRFEPGAIVGRAIGVDGEEFDVFRVLPFPGEAEAAARCS